MTHWFRRGWHGLVLLPMLGLTLLGAPSALSQSRTDSPAEEMSMLALRDNGSGLMKLLLMGQDPNLRNADFETALHVALRADSGKAVATLLKHPGLDVNTLNKAGETPLMLAAIKGRLDWVKALVARGAIVQEPGWSALHYACSGPDNGVANWLLTQGADINALSPNGSTPLMMAARYGSFSTAEMLIRAGADVLIRNQQGLKAEDFARSAGRDDLAKTLREFASRKR